MARQHRTAQGRALDMDALILKNEKVRAVGNISVNARGDQIDAEGNIIKTRAEIMREANRLHDDEPKKQSALEVDTEEEGA